jgi:hypothetical protein
MTERFEQHALAACFGAHRRLFEAAATLGRRLGGVHPDADLLHLGASCMKIAAHNALQSNDAWQTARSWHECALAERQIRLATFRALRDRCIETDVYDEIFRMAKQAARIREDERQRLRRQLHRMGIV